MKYKVGDIVRLKWRLGDVYEITHIISDECIAVVPVGYIAGVEVVSVDSVKRLVKS